MSTLIQSNCTTEAHILFRAHETRTILSNVVTPPSSDVVRKSMGCMSLSSENLVVNSRDQRSHECQTHGQQELCHLEPSH